jgi:hypothetical protein
VQQLSRTQHELAPHWPPPLVHGARLAHDVLPGTQTPPPSSQVTQTQSATELHPGMNVAQVAPRHCGDGPYPCANAGVLRLLRTGADQATAAPAPILFSIRRLEILPPKRPLSDVSDIHSPPSRQSLIVGQSMTWGLTTDIGLRGYLCYPPEPPYLRWRNDSFVENLRSEGDTCAILPLEGNAKARRGRNPQAG